MSRPRRPRAVRAGALTLALALMLALTGCGPINAASAAEEEFEKKFSGADGIASVETSGSNNLPFMGSVRATVTTDPNLSEKQVDAIAADLAEHMRGTSRIDWVIALTSDAVTTGISADDDTTAARLAIARKLAAAPYILSTRVDVPYERPLVFVEVDSPDALTAGYRVAAAATSRLGVEEGASSAGAATADGDFSVDDEAWDGEEPTIGTQLAIFDAARERVPLISARITPDTLTLRAAEEDDVEELKDFVATYSVPPGLTIDVQGGKTTTRADATPAAVAVAAALRMLPEVTGVHVSENVVSAEIRSRGDASAVLDAVTLAPGFREIDGFGLSAASFRVFDSPADFDASLRVAQAAADLPSIESVEASRQLGETAPKLSLRFVDAGQSTIHAFADTMKPALVAQGWDVWMNADGFVESFRAEESILLREQMTGDRDREGQAFADMLVRAWDGATG